MIAVLNRPHELKAHIRGALTNGVTPAEICEVFRFAENRVPIT
jgi:4-carboxymuconolactone decarboxylase